MSGKRLDPQEQYDVAPRARERAADETADTARTENRMSHSHDRKHRNISAALRDAVHRRRSSRMISMRKQTSKAVLREELSALAEHAPTAPREERRVVSVLFRDLLAEAQRLDG
jgi:hypothetical protein